MSIAYIWFNEYVNLKNIEMNFSPEISFHYNDNDNIITACEKEQKNNFFELLGYNNIYNATAIVGENGSGKSTIIRFFMELQFYEGSFPDYYRYIIIFYDNKKYILFTNFDLNYNFLADSNYVKNKITFNVMGRNYLYERSLKRAFSRNIVINYTDAFNPYHYHELIAFNKETDFNYSVEGRIAKYKKKYLSSKPNVDPIMFYHNKQVEEQIKVVNNFSKVYGFPKQISIEVIKEDKFESQLKKTKKEQHEVEGKINELRKIILSKYKNNLAIYYHGHVKGYSILHGLIDHLLRKMLLCLNIISDEQIKCKIIVLILNEMIDRIQKMGENVTHEDIMEILDIIVQKNGNPVLKIDSAEKEAYNKALRFLYESSDGLSYREDIEIFFFEPTLEKGWYELVEFYDAYAKTTFNGECPYLKFSWGMSTGELAQLNLFAAVNDVVKKKENKNADITFFFDEAGLYWHPRWQQEGLKRILDILNKTNHNIQLILATHSPIFLSDFPKSDTYWLAMDVRKKEECLETFGANIFNLYNDSFLWDKDNKALWVTGKFSKNVIEQIALRLSQLDSAENINYNAKKELDILKNDIEQIGEEILRRDLLAKWEKVFSKFCLDNDSEEDIIIAQFNGLSKDKQMNLLERLRSDYDG